ncbi:MAG TPA: PQQ-binding-like beta-propeller repeat protein [Vicinamibacterales bacterium]|nr:PQQ-binding-like beta-propeller repeat protein [Vicinamibacterales bacterium]
MNQVLSLLLVVLASTSLSAQPFESLRAAPSEVEGQNWPSFRGANAAGTADGKPTAVKWNAGTNENIAWKAPVEGVAVSSPIVWGDRVFVSTAVSSDPKQGIRTGQYGDVEPVSDSSKHTWHLIALDKETGKVVWDKVAHEGLPKTKRHPKSSQASATPATDGNVVVVSFGSEGLYAYDFSGKQLWKQDLGILNPGWFFDPDYEWGFGSSPIIYKNMAIVQCDIQRASFIAAFDTKTGKQLWRTAREEIPSWSTPTIFEVNGKAELVTQATTFTRGYDPMTGTELWKYSGNSEVAIPTPIVGPGIVIITNGYRGVQPIVAVKPGAKGDITLKQGETKNEYISWATTRGGPYIPTPVIYGEYMYILLGNGTLSAYKVATGEQVYQKRLGGTAGSFSASPVAADGKIYCSSEDGDVYVVKAGPEYQELAKNPIGEVIMATPAISDGLIIIRGLKNVYAIKP